MRLLRLSMMILNCCLVTVPTFGQSLEDMGITVNQKYTQAIRRLKAKNFRSVPNNLDIKNAKHDKKFPEITCGHIKNDVVDKDICVSAFEDKDHNFFDLELKKNAHGEWVVAAL